MLKGIKKSKQQSNQSQNENKKQTSNNQALSNDPNHSILAQQHQTKLFGHNQNAMKQQFIMEEQQNQENQAKCQNKQIIYEGFEQINNSEKELQGQFIRIQEQGMDLENKLKNKANQIYQFFKQGNQSKVEEYFNDFEKIEQIYFGNKNHIEQQSFAQEKNTKQRQFGNQKKSQKQKGRFQYNFNYEQSDDEKQKGKKSLKRSHKSRPIMKSQKIQDYCVFCPDNEELRLISASNYVYLAFPKRKTFKKYWHFILAPVQHQQSTIGLNDDVLTQLSNYKKCLLQMFDKKNYIVVFFQQFSQENSHIYIECLAVPLTKGQDFPFFFKQSLESVQGNWTTHKTLIKIEKQKGGLQKQIPKKIKYFYIDFSLGYGYAHVIENQNFWKREFCYETLATPLGVELYEVKTAAQFTDEQLDTKQQQFKKMWEPFDWTKYI